jgi:hypothetical protein
VNPPTLVCLRDERRDRTRYSNLSDSKLFGLDYLEVSYNTLAGKAPVPTLTVFFLGKAPEKDLTPADLLISGGQRIVGIQVVGVVMHRSKDGTEDDSMDVSVDKDGDFSTYRLCAVNPDDSPIRFDPRYACIDFTFKAGCPTDLDCLAQTVCPPLQRVEPEVNYLAKDYSSFRQLILDRLALIMPDWKEQHVPDIGIALVEVLAYVGDYLSYYQDAVATEAYLETARKRISVRRHARLVDYRINEGCNARAWVCIESDSSTDQPLDFANCFFITTPQSGNLSQSGVLPKSALSQVPQGDCEVFEALAFDDRTSITVWPQQNRMEFYTWGNLECCLPKGATSATLKDVEASDTPSESTNNGSGRPQVGDVLIFEEVLGPITGNPADADPKRRCAVRLVRVDATTDPLDGTRILEIEWTAQDSLPFPLCLSARLPAPECCFRENISVARGNVILVDYGQTLDPEPLGQVGTATTVGQCACEGTVVEMTYSPKPFCPPALKQSPLTFRQELRVNPKTPASKMLPQDPRKAVPAITLQSIPPAPDHAGPLFKVQGWPDRAALAQLLRQPVDSALLPLRTALSFAAQQALDKWDGAGPVPDDALTDLTALIETWTPVGDLLESHAEDRSFVVEIDDDGAAHLRFGDGVLGRQPEAGMEFSAKYRVGNGPIGNVPAESITRIVVRSGTLSGLTPRNPLPAQGGTAPESIDEVKLFAPGAFRKELERAITAADYAVIAERNPKLQQAHARLCWTGSWYEAHVAVDPLGTETANEALLYEIQRYLYRFRRLGHDLEVRAARYVPLDIELTVCVLPHFLRGHVEAAVLDVLSNRQLPDGRQGFFYPDNLTFGEGIYLSKLVAAVQAVPGVQNVIVDKFQRFAEAANHEIENGILPLGADEIAQLDNDPSFPEHGTLKLNMGGGR